jgi:flavin reductase (DIM6/NTAB) family NADH-FMN oxidoreductase RutF
MNARMSEPIVDAARCLPDVTGFRRSVSLFATGIAVVSSEDSTGAAHGMTVNSFTSISLDPPTVMVSLKPGKTHGLISDNGWYGLSILSHEQENVSRHFGGHPQPALAPVFSVRHIVPTLRDCLAWFECRISDRVQVHDHTLFIARVASCGHREASPLMFFASRYHRPALPLITAPMS